jgi:hypothetical protein
MALRVNQRAGTGALYTQNAARRVIALGHGVDIDRRWDELLQKFVVAVQLALLL